MKILQVVPTTSANLHGNFYEKGVVAYHGVFTVITVSCISFGMILFFLWII